jgi:hypothetical protein
LPDTTIQWGSNRPNAWGVMMLTMVRQAANEQHCTLQQLLNDLTVAYWAVVGTMVQDDCGQDLERSRAVAAYALDLGVALSESPAIILPTGKIG